MVSYTLTNTQLLQFDILNLDPYELVEVNVSASNSAGEGPKSPGVRGRTREERKLKNDNLHRYSKLETGMCLFLHFSPWYCEQLSIKVD